MLCKVQASRQSIGRVGSLELRTESAGADMLGLVIVQGGPSALGRNYVDTKFEVAFSYKFYL